MNKEIKTLDYDGDHFEKLPGLLISIFASDSDTIGDTF
jgi:hypothetical protein